jgi:hypothetical protein
MYVTSDRSGGNRRSDGWCKQWIRGIIKGAIDATSDKMEQLKERWIRGQMKERWMVQELVPEVMEAAMDHSVSDLSGRNERREQLNER